MRLAFCLILFFGGLGLSTTSSPASAQLSGATSITGRVVDTSGKPVANATVSLVQLGLETRTDSNGRFDFSGTPASDYTITVRRAGSTTVTINRVRPGYSLAEVVLIPSATVIDPVTVTAARGATEVGASVLPVSTLSEEMIRRDATISLAHSLIRLPGVRSVSTGEQIGKPMIRGFYGSRVLTLENGSRLEDYSWSEEDAPSVDARLAQRVEVIRGPASVLYGSDAIGGVVNVIPQDLPVTTDGQSFRRIGGELYGASNNRETGGALNLEGASGKFGWRATGIGRLAQSYDTPAGEVEHTGFFSINGEAAAGIRGARSNTTLRFSHYGGEFKLLEARGPGSGTAVEGEEEGPERKLADERLQLVHDQFMGRFRLQTKAQFQRHSLVEVSDDLCLIDPTQCVLSVASSSTAPAKNEQTAFDLLLNTGTLDILGHTSFGSTDRFVAGVSGIFQKNDSRGPIFLIPSATTSSGAAFLFEEATFGRLGIAGGARVDFRKVSADANPSIGLTSSDDRNWTQPSGNFGVVLHATPQISVRANAGAAWRAPTLFELYANGPHLAEGRYEIGDKGLDPEKSLNLDVGLRWQSSRASIDLSGFRNKITEFIYLSPTNEFSNNLRIFRHLSADALMTGGEASAEFSATPNFIVRARHDFVRGTNQDLDQPLPLIAPPRTAGGAEYHFTTGSFGDVFLAGEVENVMRQKRPNEFDVVTAGYTLLNFDLGFRHTLLGRPARVDLGIRNAANRKYRSFLSRYKEFALEPGRNIMLRISTEP
jgi:iron complex outermembrane receptor protein